MNSNEPGKIIHGSPRKHKYRRFCNVIFSETEDEAPATGIEIGLQSLSTPNHNSCKIGSKNDSPNVSSDFSETSPKLQPHKHKKTKLSSLPSEQNMTKEISDGQLFNFPIPTSSSTKPKEPSKPRESESIKSPIFPNRNSESRASSVESNGKSKQPKTTQQDVTDTETTESSSRKKKKKRKTTEEGSTASEAYDSSEMETHTAEEDSSVSHDSPDFVEVEQIYSELKGDEAKTSHDKDKIKKNKLNVSLAEESEKSSEFETETPVPASLRSTPLETRENNEKLTQNTTGPEKRKQTDESSSDEYYLSPNNVSTGSFKSPIIGKQKKSKYNSTTYSSSSYEASQVYTCSYNLLDDSKMEDSSCIPPTQDSNCKIDIDYHDIDSYDKFKCRLNTISKDNPDECKRKKRTKKENYETDVEFSITPNQSKSEGGNQSQEELVNNHNYENSRQVTEDLIIITNNPSEVKMEKTKKKHKHGRSIKDENFEDPSIYDVSTECLGECDAEVGVKKKKKKHKKHDRNPNVNVTPTRDDVITEEHMSDQVPEDDRVNKKKKGKTEDLIPEELETDCDEIRLKKKKKKKDGELTSDSYEIRVKKKKREKDDRNIDNEVYNSLIDLNDSILETPGAGDIFVVKNKKKKRTNETGNEENYIITSTSTSTNQSNRTLEEEAGNAIEGDTVIKKDSKNNRVKKKKEKTSFKINLQNRSDLHNEIDDEEENITTDQLQRNNIFEEQPGNILEDDGIYEEESDNYRVKKKKKKTHENLHSEEYCFTAEAGVTIKEEPDNDRRVKKKKKKSHENLQNEENYFTANRLSHNETFEEASDIIEGGTIKQEPENDRPVKKKKKRPVENDEGYAMSNRSKVPEDNQENIKNVTRENELDNSSTSTGATKENKKRKKSDEENEVESNKKRKKDDNSVEKNRKSVKRTNSDKEETATKGKKKRKGSTPVKNEQQVDPSALLAFRQKCNELSKHTLEKLSNLKIEVDWEECPLHADETRVSKHPSKKFKERMEAKYDVKKGRFSGDEDRMIVANFRAFCERYDLKKDPRPFLKFTQDCKKTDTMVLKSEQRIKFVKYLARGLNDRYLHQVYKRFQRINFKDFKRHGGFNEEEDELILRHMESESLKPIYELSIMLKREYLSVYKRYLKLTQKGTPVHWDKDTIEAFLKALLDVTLASGIDEFKRREITSSDFKQISELLDISVYKLRYGWYHVIHPKLFVKRLSAGKMHETRINLVNIIYEKKYTDWKDINFQEVAEHFPGFSPVTLSSQLQSMFKRLVPQDLRTNFRKAIKYLYKNYEWKSRVNTPNRILSLSFDNGEIKVRMY